MAIEKGGIPITGFISPNDLTDTYPTHKDKYGQGGHRTVDNHVALLAISPERRIEGMTVYVKDTKKLFQLVGGITNDKWQEIYSIDNNGLTINIDCPPDYVLEGDLSGIARPSPALLDIRLDLIEIKTAPFIIEGKKELNTFPEATYLGDNGNGFLYNTDGVLTIESAIPSDQLLLEHNKLFIGDITGKASQVEQITIENLPPLGTFEYAPDLISGQIWRGTGDNKAELSNSLSIAEADLLFITSRFALNTFVVNSRSSIPLVTPFSSQVLSDLGGGLAKIQPVTGRFTIAVSGVDYVNDEQFQQLTGRVNTLEGRLDTLTGQVEEIQADVLAIDATLVGIDTSITGLTLSVAALQTQVFVLDGLVSSLSSDVSSLQTRMTSIENRVESLETSINSINSQLITINSTLLTHTLEILALTNNIVENKLLFGGVGKSILSLSSPTTSNNVLMCDGVNAPFFSNVQYLNNSTANKILYSSQDNIIGQISNIANSVLINNNAGEPSFSNTLPLQVQNNITQLTNVAVSSLITVPTPVTGTEATNKNYVDTAVSSVLPVSTANTIFISDSSNVKSFSNTLPTDVQANISRYNTSIATLGANQSYSFDSANQNTTTSLINNFTPIGSSLAKNTFSLKNGSTKAFSIQYISFSGDITGYGGVDFIFTGTSGTRIPMQIFYTNGFSNYEVVLNAVVDFNSTVYQYKEYILKTGASTTLNYGSSFTAESGSSLTVNGTITVPTPTLSTQAANKDYVDTTVASSSAAVLPTSIANSVLISDVSNVKSFSSFLPTAVQTNITNLGTVTTGTWNATNISLAKGGTNASLTANNGGIVYSTASALAVLAGTNTAGRVLRSGVNSAPSWSTLTLPNTIGINSMLFASATNTISPLSSIPYAVLATDIDGVPGFSPGLPPAVTAYINTVGTIVSGVWNGTAIAVANGGTGSTSASLARTNLATAPNTTKYIVQTADVELPNAQSLSALSTGILRNTTTTGVLSIATVGTDYFAPSADINANSKNIFSVNRLSVNTTNTTTAAVNIIGGVQNVASEETCIRVAPSNGTITAVGIELAWFKNWKIKSMGTGDFYIFGDNTWAQRLDINNSFYVNTSSTTKNSNSTWTIASDKKLKKDIQTHDKGIADILKLKVKKYKYTEEFEKDFHESEKNKTCVGLIAQDVQEVFPDCITNMKDKDGNNALHMNIHEIIMTLITSVQELHNEITLLKQKSK